MHWLRWLRTGSVSKRFLFNQVKIPESKKMWKNFVLLLFIVAFVSAHSASYEYSDEFPGDEEDYSSDESESSVSSTDSDLEDIDLGGDTSFVDMAHSGEMEESFLMLSLGPGAPVLEGYIKFRYQTIPNVKANTSPKRAVRQYAARWDAHNEISCEGHCDRVCVTDGSTETKGTETPLDKACKEMTQAFYDPRGVRDVLYQWKKMLVKKDGSLISRKEFESKVGASVLHANDKYKKVIVAYENTLKLYPIVNGLEEECKSSQEKCKNACLVWEKYAKCDKRKGIYYKEPYGVENYRHQVLSQI